MNKSISDSLLDSSFVPEGQLKVARPFRAGYRIPRQCVPAGRLNSSTWLIPQTRPPQASLRDARHFLSLPGTQVPGYFQPSLRGRTEENNPIRKLLTIVCCFLLRLKAIGNRYQLILFALLLLLAGPARSYGQQEPDFKTTPTLSRTSFVMVITPTQVEKAPPPPPGQKPQHPIAAVSQVEVSRFDANQRNRLTWSDGAKTEDWVVGNYFLQQSLYGNWVNIDAISSYEFKGAYFFMTMRDACKWISPSTFVDRRSLDGKMANYFEQAEKKAWIDPKTGTLLAIEQFEHRYTFTFGTPPEAALPIPLAYQELLNLANLPATTRRR